MALCLVAICCGTPVRLAAQSFTATLEGLVTDSSNSIIPGAKVVLTNEGTNVKLARDTDNRGYYFFTMLPPGNYRLEVMQSGFKTYSRTGIVLQVQQAARVDVALSLGEISTKVEVSGEAPRLDTVDATLGRVVDNKSMLDMPLGSRNPLALAVLTPGLVPVGGYPSGGGVNFSANGGRLSQTDVLLDGVSLTVMEHNSGIQQIQLTPTVETVQEFKVQTNSFGAEYGNTGGAVIGMVSRSGTNQLHGDLFEFHRNNVLTANTFFANRNGDDVSVYSWNQFGGVLGGPVYIPKVYDGRNKTFFFVHHERTKTPASKIIEQDTVPTALEKSGDFSRTFDSQGNLITIYDPSTVTQNSSGTWSRTAFAGNVIPTSMWSSVAAKAIAYYPNPTGDGTGPAHLNNYYATGRSENAWNEWTVKIDHNFNDRQRVSGRYTRDDTNNRPLHNLWGDCPSGAPSEYCQEGNFMASSNSTYTIDKPQNAIVDYTHVLSPTTVLNLRAGVTRQLWRQDGFGAIGSFDSSVLGFTGPSLQIQNSPGFSIDGYSNLGVASNRIVENSTTYQVIGDLTRVMGKHTFKAGGDARFAYLNYGQPGISTASFSFSRQATMSEPLSASALQGNALASFLLGWGSSGSQGVDLTSLVAARTYNTYIQDDFHVTRKLTLNFGLRWELLLPSTERHNRSTTINLNATSPLAGKVSSSSCPACSNLRGGYEFASSSNRRMYETHWNDLAPRFGFAYQLFDRTAVRGGYGLFYGLSSGQLTAELGDGFVTSTTWNTSTDGGIHQLYSLSNPFPNGINLPAGSSNGLSQGLGDVLYGPMKGLNVTPQIQQWSLSVQHQLRGNSVVQLAYSGSKGTHLGSGGMRRWANLIDPSYASLGDALFDQVKNPFYGLVPSTSSLATETVSRLQLLRPYPQYSGISARPGPPNANSIYHALQLQFTKRFSQGLQATAHYTFSKSIDDASSADDPNLDWLTSSINGWGGGRARVQDYSNLRLERSVSTFDIPHRFIVDFSYELPIGRGRALGKDWNRWVDAVAGGWQVNGILTLESGVPLIPHVATSVLAESSQGMKQRPNILSNPTVDGSVESKLNNYLNAAAFSTPAAYKDGTAPRTMGYARGPGFHQADISMFKQFYLSENRSRYLQLRGEAFNFTNTPVFGLPGTTVGDSSFGVISSQANGARTVQLGAKLYF